MNRYRGTAAGRHSPYPILSLGQIYIKKGETIMNKQEIIAKYAMHEGDTGSPEVQIALLTARIIAGTKI